MDGSSRTNTSTVKGYACVQRMKSVSFYPSTLAAPSPNVRDAFVPYATPSFLNQERAQCSMTKGPSLEVSLQRPDISACRYQGRRHANTKV